LLSGSVSAGRLAVPSPERKKVRAVIRSFKSDLITRLQAIMLRQASRKATSRSSSGEEKPDAEVRNASSFSFSRPRASFSLGAEIAARRKGAARRSTKRTYEITRGFSDVRNIEQIESSPSNFGARAEIAAEARNRTYSRRMIRPYRSFSSRKLARGSRGSSKPARRKARPDFLSVSAARARARGRKKSSARPHPSRQERYQFPRTPRNRLVITRKKLFSSPRAVVHRASVMTRGGGSPLSVG